MNTLLWIAQGLLGVAFILAGIMKAAKPKEKIEEKLPWAADYSLSSLKFIGISELLGGLGLILPMALGIRPILTVIAAFSLALLMLLAMRTHLRRKEIKESLFNIVVMAIALFIAFSRF